VQGTANLGCCTQTPAMSVTNLRRSHSVYNAWRSPVDNTRKS